MSQNKVSIAEVASTLLHKDNILILSHASPDGDTLGSAFALCEALQTLNKTVACKCADDIPKDYTWFKPVNCDFTPSYIISVDTADTKLFGGLSDEYSDIIDLNIDHHPSNHLYARNNCVVFTACATCEIIYDIIISMGVKLTPGMATALYTGIATDSGCFKYQNTTAKTHITAAACIDAGAPYGEISQKLFDTKSKERIAIETIAMQLIEYYAMGRCAVIPITLEMRESTNACEDDLHGITSLPRQITGVLVGVVIKEKEPGKYKLSVRTKAPLDGSLICANFGGGGHARAAGCEICGTLDEVREKIVSVITAELDKA